MKRLSPFLALLLSSLPLMQAQTPSPPPSECRQFDFWVGEWEVTNQQTGKKAGENSITLAHHARVLLENWRSVSPFTGSSVNAYDAATKRWHQCWMDSTGGVLDLYGGLDHDRMMLSGETIQPNGARQLERITWTPNADGSVRQHWEQSADGGNTWQTAFDGLYRRKPKQ